MRWIEASSAVAAILMLASACGPALSAQDSDRSLTRALQQELRSRSELGKVNGVVHHGAVYLHGSVGTASQRAAAEQLARQATGIDTIYNAVQVGPYTIYD